LEPSSINTNNCSQIADFGEFNGVHVKEITLQNIQGAIVKIITYGAAIRALWVPDRNGTLTDVVLGFDNLEGYLQKSNRFFGAVIGPVANRISNGEFEIEGVRYTLSKNRGAHCIHGGFAGLDKQVWDIKYLEEENEVCLQTIWKDGREGFPGNLLIELNYKLTDTNVLELNYQVLTDCTTHINLTNHSYFNLSGPPATTILDHYVQLNSTRYSEVDSDLIPTGNTIQIEGGLLDFHNATLLGERIPSLIEGFDHNMILDKEYSTFSKAGSLYSKLTGIAMAVWTDQPALQFYTSNFLDGSLKGKYNLNYVKYAGLCMETQHFPDTPNHSNFPSTLIKAGECYRQQTYFSFTIE
jgi:aldose 1-epimerase